ncbi:MAG: oxalate/formate MFS antiporter, partial [Betaproteobacteria bacterium]|nr:oxalate/formate MFS antiporter [Betaproteobacteria bacterium]
FGVKYATGNAGALYTAKGTASLLVPLTALFVVKGDWNRVFIISAVLSFGAALAAKFILQPMRHRFIENSNKGLQEGAAAGNVPQTAAS